MNRILVLSDLHLDWRRANQIIEKESGNFDFCLMLGDYFDSWYDTPEQNAEMAKWLVDKFNDKRFILLTGNHDVTPLYSSTYTRCSGNTQEKSEVINSVFSKVKGFRPEKYFKFFHYDNDRNILFTHAGLSCHYLESVAEFNPKNSEELIRWLTCKEVKLIQDLYNDRPNTLVCAGYSRGGRQSVGGINWCDWTEFKPIPFISQIFGHSVLRKVGIIDNNYCLDTWASGLYSYILIDQEIQIKYL